MYQVIGLMRALTGFSLACLAVFLLWAFLAPPANFVDLKVWWRIASSSVTFVSLVVVFVGQTPIFPALCRLPLVRSWFPPIDGEWIATLESNWPVIKRLVDPNSTFVLNGPTQARITIISRLFFIRMNLVTDSRYSTSKTIFVRVMRDEHDASAQLYYVYRNTTLTPAETDSGSHNGAACLDIHVEKNGEIWMDGAYWTDRNWVKGMNTAGKITLRRNAVPPNL